MSGYFSYGAFLTAVWSLSGTAGGGGSALRAAEPAVQVAEERVVIPTYELGPSDRNPMFYMHESYQGAQKRIYPYPLQDHLTHVRQDKSYTSLRLENQYTQLTVLPEIGGRLFSATDKTNGYDFFYRQHVIKPALIGMLGAWISGGVEWCAFHHHRNTTFMPVDYRLEDNHDGSKTIWFGEMERRHRMRWLIGLTLYPDKSYIEAQVKFFNRTAQPHSILYWANVAVHVNDQYQVFFPPSVQVATYHSKIDFVNWPIAQGTYRGHDYTDVDISWWKNSPVSNSFFAWDLQEDFMGGYDHGQQAGVVHVSNHHLVCGAKLWEWGTGTYGRAWDKILTDEDGPYAELMVGAFSDNQPDYSWIKPHEVKTVKQYWYPIRGIGGFKNANLNGAVNLKLQDRSATFGFCTTARHIAARATLQIGTQVAYEKTLDIDPATPFVETVEVPAGTKPTDVRVALQSAAGKTLVAYQPVEQKKIETLPPKVAAPPKPSEIQTVEELYLTGLRVEQIHNPSVDPQSYYLEALRRDPGDSRCNTMLGIHANKQGRYAEAEQYLRKAVERVSAEYTRPKDTEAYYQLGLALRAQHRNQEAYDAFYRATWDQAFHTAAYYQLAELASLRQDFRTALEHLDQALSTNMLDTQALNLRAAVLRRLARFDLAARAAMRALQIDPLDFRAMYEYCLISASTAGESEAAAAWSKLAEKMRDNVQAYLELACDYMQAGMWDDAAGVLERLVARQTTAASNYPLVFYYLGYVRQQLGATEDARNLFAQGAAGPSDYCFPFRLEGLDVLGGALDANLGDGRAHYYLGNLLFDRQPDAAIEHWRKARDLDGTLATVHRNLGWANYRVKNDLAEAMACYERAIACDRRDPRLFLELDTLYEFANVEPAKRLAALRPNHETVVQRQDSFLREITVLVLAGEYEAAIRHLDENSFAAQEGREEIHDVYVDAHLLQGLRLLQAGEADAALAHFRRAGEYPENLSVGRPKNDPRAAEVAYFTAVACRTLGNAPDATKYFEQAAGQTETASWPVTRYYQARSLTELGRTDEARAIDDELVRTGTRRLKEDDSSDFFAKFGQQQTTRSRTAEAHFILGLGLAGQGKPEQARQQFREAAAMNLSHVWAAHYSATGSSP